MCCPFTVKIKCSSDGDTLMVASLVNDHNHDINKVTSYWFESFWVTCVLATVYNLYVDTITLAS